MSRERTMNSLTPEQNKLRKLIKTPLAHNSTPQAFVSEPEMTPTKKRVYEDNDEESDFNSNGSSLYPLKKKTRVLTPDKSIIIMLLFDIKDEIIKKTCSHVHQQSYQRMDRYSHHRRYLHRSEQFHFPQKTTLKTTLKMTVRRN